MATISKEDVIDAIDEENENRLDILTDYWQNLVDEDTGNAQKLVERTTECAKLLYSAKAYQDTLDWLDSIGLSLAKTFGEESEIYELFIEDENLENIRMEALDKSSIEEEEEEFELDDE